MDSSNGKKYNNTGDSVTPVIPLADNWIKCKSVSHDGQPYYFNTVTGCSVWNISEEEIERAKSTTKHLSNQELEMGMCPEPKEKPPHNEPPPLTNTTSTSGISNTTLHLKPATFKFYNDTQHIPFFENESSSDSLNRAVLNYAQNLSVEPNQNVSDKPSLYNGQIDLIGQNRTGQNNFAQYQVVPHNIPITHGPSLEMSQPSSSTLNPFLLSKMDSMSRHSTNYVEIKNCSGKLQRNRQMQQALNNKFFSKINQPQKIECNKLRQKLLLAKKHRETLCVSKAAVQMSEEEDYGAYSDVDSDWLEDNIIMRGTKLVVNVANLKNLALPNVRSDCWYILVDKKILLRNLSFLNYLISSDDNCHLVVPREELLELRAIAEEGVTPQQKRRARRALAFLSQQLEAGGVIGEEDFDDDFNYLINCCINLIEQNYHVILLSNDSELKIYSNHPGMNILTLKEVKRLLSNTDEERAEDTDTEPIVFRKVTIVNDKKASLNVSTENAKFENKRRVILVQNEEVTQTVDSTSTVTDCKVDTAVQTDVPTTDLLIITLTEENDGNKSEISEKQTSKSLSRVTSVATTSEFDGSSNTSETASNSKPAAKQIIRLNRSSWNSSVPVFNSLSENSNEKIKFKWRRKRQRPPDLSETKSPSAIDAVCTVTSDNGAITQTASKRICNEKNYMQAIDNDFNTKDLDASNDGNVVHDSVSSENNFQRSTNINNKTIEETSTSGVVSNTTSCLDFENDSLIHNFTNDSKNTKTIGDNMPTQNLNVIMNKNIMFEITDQAMEESLKERRDEWVSRLVQIMEKALVRVLEQYEHTRATCTTYMLEQFEHERSRTGWALYFVVESIKVRFAQNLDILDATSKFTSSLFKICHRGEILINLAPTDFMETYSYAVYLIDTLEAELQDLEDIKIASESLSKLLSDIRSHGLNVSHSNTYPPEDLDDPECGEKDMHIQNNVCETDTTKLDTTINNKSNEKNQHYSLQKYFNLNNPNTDNRENENYPQRQDSELHNARKCIQQNEPNNEDRDNKIQSKPMENRVAGHKKEKLRQSKPINDVLHNRQDLDIKQSESKEKEDVCQKKTTEGVRQTNDVRQNKIERRRDNEKNDLCEKNIDGNVQQNKLQNIQQNKEDIQQNKNKVQKGVNQEKPEKDARHNKTKDVTDQNKVDKNIQRYHTRKYTAKINSRQKNSNEDAKQNNEIEDIKQNNSEKDITHTSQPFEVKCVRRMDGDSFFTSLNLKKVNIRATRVKPSCCETTDNRLSSNNQSISDNSRNSTHCSTPNIDIKETVTVRKFAIAKEKLRNETKKRLPNKDLNNRKLKEKNAARSCVSVVDENDKIYVFSALKILREHRESFDCITSFCENTYKELSQSSPPNCWKLKQCKLAETSHECVDRIVKNYYNILFRNTSNLNSSFQSLLRERVQINRVHTKDLDYRAAISKLMDDALNLLDTLNIILKILRN